MEIKTCTRCKREKHISEFNRRKDRLHLVNSPGGYTSMCSSCLAQYVRLRYARNDAGYRDQQREWSRITYQRLKADILREYGGICVCCGETEPVFLTVDHIDGSGADDRRNGGGLGGSLYLRLKREGFPKDNFQLLCFNCNCAKRQTGQCPHVTARQVVA